MTDFAAARRMMVDGQVRTSDVTDLRIIAAMLELPRERFVPDPKLAYLDLDVAARCRIGAPPAQADGARQDGAGGRGEGGSTACSMSVAPPAIPPRCWPGSRPRVTALEEDPALARRATDNLKAVGADNATVVTGPLAQGWRQEASDVAPYDVIFLNGATEVVPDALCRQLADGGRLIAILRRAPTGQVTIFRAAGGDVSGWPIFDASAAVLPGFAAAPAFVF